MKYSIRIKIVLITIAILFFALGTNTIISNYVFTVEYSDAIQSKIVVIGYTLKAQLDSLLSLGIPLENLFGFEEQCQSIVKKYSEVSYAMVVDPEGMVLFHSDPARHKEMVSDQKILSAIKGAKESVQLYYENGKEYYDIIIPVFGSDENYIGAVRLGFPSDVIKEKTYIMTVYSVLVAAVSFLIAIALLFFTISAWVSKPLMKLVTAIQEIRKDAKDLGRKVEIYSKDEIGELASAFNQMIQDLKASRAKLQEYSRGLETQVAERTKQLEDSKKQLESKMEELERFNKMAIGRELKMIELKKRIKELEEKLKKEK